MKNIFVGGMYRTGKSTLCTKLYRQLHYSVFELDSVVHAFTKVYPEIGINENKPENFNERFFPFADVMIKCVNYGNIYNNIISAINGWHLSPEEVSKLKVANNFIVVFLGITNMTVDELVDTIKSTSTESDWIANEREEKIYNLCKKIIEKSKVYKAQCKKLGYIFVETGKNREENLQELVNKIKKINI